MGELLWFLCGILVLILLAIIRAIALSTALDRLLVVNAVSTMVCIVILLLAFIRSDFGFIDVALVFILCGFIGTASILRTIFRTRQKAEEDSKAEGRKRKEVV